MLTACWSVKGGSGTTVVAAGLVLGLAAVDRAVVAADFGGDLPAVLGVAEPAGPGLLDWLDAGPSVPADGLGRITP
jgi:CO dehydrogenase nickel-insertion accessory protein CooC1